MLHLHECVAPGPTESAAEPLHSVGNSAAVEESAIKPLHSADDPAIKPLQSVANSDATVDAPTEISYS
jgi:hypothetical protein